MTPGTDNRWPDRATLRTLLMIAAVVMAAWGIYDHVIAQILLDEVGTASLANRLGEHLLLGTPLAFYVCGLWLLARFLDGANDAGATAARLGAARSSFLIGAGAEIVIVPTLLRWVALRGGFDLTVNGSAVAVAALALCLPFVMTTGAISTRKS